MILTIFMWKGMTALSRERSYSSSYGRMAKRQGLDPVQLQRDTLHEHQGHDGGCEAASRDTCGHDVCDVHLRKE